MDHRWSVGWDTYLASRRDFVVANIDVRGSGYQVHCQGIRVPGTLPGIQGTRHNGMSGAQGTRYSRNLRTKGTRYRITSRYRYIGNRGSGYQV